MLLSLTMAVTRARLALRNIRAGAKAGLAVDNGRLLVDPQPRPRYTLEELLAQCDGAADLTDDDRTWLDDTPTGDELI